MKHKWSLPVAAGITVLSIVCMITILMKQDKQLDFTPPPFEPTVEVGTPSVDESLGWSEIMQDGMGFTAHVCGNVILNDKSAQVYFTNDKENTVWMKLRVLNESDEVLGETGILKPGEYVTSVELNKTLKQGDNIKLKIMAYQPETYYSEGAVALSTSVTLGGE